MVAVVADAVWPRVSGFWVGLPAVCWAVAILGLALAIGQLLVADLFVAGPAHGVPGDGMRVTGSSRLRGLALVQVLACALGAVLTIAHGGSSWWAGPDMPDDNLEDLPSAASYLLASVLAAIAMACSCRRPAWPILLVLELAVPLPLVVSVTESVRRSPGIVGGSLVVLLLSALLWLGGAVPLVLMRWCAGAEAPVVSRYVTISTWTLPLVGSAGGALAGYLIATDDPFDSAYGWLVLLCPPAFIIALGPVVRRFHTAVLRRRRPAVCLPLVDVIRLTVAVVVSFAVCEVVHPRPPIVEPSGLVDMIGYELPMHLTAIDLIERWRPDMIFGALAVTAATLYLRGVHRLSQNGRRWPLTRSVAWIAGCVLLLVATSSGIGSYAPVVFSVAMVQHTLLMTAVPCLLVLGHGISLLVDVSSDSATRGIGDLLDCSSTRLITDPIMVWLTSAVVLFGLYPTGLYAALLPWHSAHPAMNLAFLIAGLAQFWIVLGDSLRRRLPPIGQFVMIFSLMGLHAGFAVWLLDQASALAPEHYLEMPAPYIPDILTDQRRGATLGWAIADIPTVLAVVVLAAKWAGEDRQGPRPRGDGFR